MRACRLMATSVDLYNVSVRRMFQLSDPPGFMSDLGRQLWVRSKTSVKSVFNQFGFWSPEAMGSVRREKGRNTNERNSLELI